MNGIFNILDWLVEADVLGLPVAVPLALAVTVLAWLGYRRWQPSGHVEQTVEADTIGKTQQTSLQNIRAKGDVNVSSRQE